MVKSQPVPVNAAKCLEAGPPSASDKGMLANKKFLNAIGSGGRSFIRKG
jgi:hypothetical protein